MTTQLNSFNEKIEILVVDPSENHRKNIMDICTQLDGVITKDVSTAKDALNHLFFNQSEIVILALKLPDSDGFKTAKKIKDLYPKTVIIALVTFLDQRIEKELNLHGISGYIGKPITETGRIKYRINGYINHIRASKHTARLTTSYTALNPFSSDIRSIKTTITISNEEEMMDLGLWLIERYTAHNSTQGMRFNRSIDLLYGTITYAIKHHTSTTVLIEENFDALFICISLYKAPKHQAIADRFASTIGENIQIINDRLFLRIYLKEPQESVATPQATQKELLATSEKAHEMLRKSHVDKISAVSYMATLNDIDLDEVRDLEDIEDGLKNALSDLTYSPNQENFVHTGELLSYYASKINSLYEFSTLGYAISSLGLMLGNISISQLEVIETKKISMLLNAILEDISKWRETIFVSKSTQDIHYLDSSLLSSSMQIENLMLNFTPAKDDDADELELF